MTTRTPDFNAFFAAQKRAMAPWLELSQLAARNFEKLARQGYEAAGEALDLAVAQAHAAVSAKDPAQFATRQSELATDFVARQSARSNELLKFAACAQTDFGKWVEAASGEFTAATRKGA